MRLFRNILTVAALLMSTMVSADEGFWLVQDINAVLENNMRAKGLRLRPKEIYNVDAPGSGLADAVVSLGFKYSGSIVSDWGLVLTCADPAITFMDRLGDVGQQLLKDGFHAVSEAHEIPVEGEKIYSLKRVFDVTEEVKSMRQGGMGYEEITSRLENAYNESTTLKCRLTSEWAGTKYYIAAYKVYDDVRLVVMPPLALARMGGEEGKWSWPAHRCDFALFRIYDNGKPVSGAKTLDVSLDGYSEGSFTMTLGFPRFTERFLPSAGMRFKEDVALPLTNSLRGARLEIIRRMMADDKSVGKLYSSRAKELEEILEVDKGVKKYYGSYSLTPARENAEQWMADSFLGNLDRVFKETRRVETDKILRDETLRDGTFVGSYLRRAASAGDLGKMKEILLAGVRETDPATEKELLEYALSEYYTNMDDYYMGDFQRWIQDRFGYDYAAAAEYLWKGSLLSSQSKIQEMADPSEINGDLLFKFLNDSPLSLYDGRKGHKAALDQTVSLSQEYVRKIHDDGLRRGVPVYPDANSTARFTYGTVTEGYTTPAEYLALLDPQDPDRDLGPNLKALMMKDFWGRWGFKVGGKKHRMVIDFISDNDFVDGCQGSPVLDSQGHLIGVVSGGTPETKAGSAFYKEDGGKCVNTDIHFVLWYLGKGIELKRIVKEFEIL
ncbi:MAG: S46 family peptidase [Bacteroidales bacterium]|nr:S46 family peptidase [Bacteroidales bacterium]